MDDVVDDVMTGTGAAVAIKDGASGKPAMPSLGAHGEDEHEEKGNEDNSGESEVINPPEGAGGESTSHPEGRKPRLSKGNQSHGPKAIKSKSTKSGDEGQARRTPKSSVPKAPVAQVSNGDSSIGSNGETKNSKAIRTALFHPKR